MVIIPEKIPVLKYLCMTGSEPMDFLDVYRLDKEIEQEMKGMTKAQKEVYLKGLMGWTDEDESPSPIDLLPDGSEEFDIF